MKKLFISYFLIFAMLFSLTACGQQEITIDSLLEKMSKVNMDKYYQVAMTMDMSEKTEDGTVSMLMSSTVEGNADVSHMYDTTMIINWMGYNIDSYMEAWANSNGTYTNVTVLDGNSGWIYTADEDENNSGFALNLETLNDRSVYTMEERGKDEDYILSRSLSEDEINALIGELIASAENMAGIDTFNYTNGQLKIIFDKKTLDLKQISVSGTGEDDFSMIMKMEYITINGNQSVEIPADVIAEAVDSSTLDIDFSGEVENDGLGYDDYLDPMADQLTEEDPYIQYIALTHDDELTTLYYSTMDENSDSIYSSFTVYHLSKPCDWYDIDEEYKNSCGIMALNVELYSGSADEDTCIYIYEDEDMSTVFAAAKTDDMWIYAQADNFEENGTIDEMLEHISEVFEKFGIEMQK